MKSQFAYMTSSSNVFDVEVFLLSILVTGPSVNIITVSRVRTIYHWLNRNPEIGNISVGVLQNIWRLGWVRDTQFSTNVSHEVLLNAEKFQDYSFYLFWDIKGKSTGDKITSPPSTKIRGLRDMIKIFQINKLLFLCNPLCLCKIFATR